MSDRAAMVPALRFQVLSQVSGVSKHAWNAVVGAGHPPVALAQAWLECRSMGGVAP